MATPKFPLGNVVITPTAFGVLQTVDVLDGLQRHVCGDWGDLDEHDRLENERSLVEGYRLLSVYHDHQNTKFWIITEADRSVTTILLPEDY